MKDLEIKDKSIEIFIDFCEYVKDKKQDDIEVLMDYNSRKTYKNNFLDTKTYLLEGESLHDGFYTTKLYARYKDEEENVDLMESIFNDLSNRVKVSKIPMKMIVGNIEVNNFVSYSLDFKKERSIMAVVKNIKL